MSPENGHKIYPFNLEFKRLTASYDKLKNDDSDSFTLFFIRCYHLCDSLIASGYNKNLVYSYVKQSRALSLCKDLANTIKHKKPSGDIISLEGFDPISRHVDLFDNGKVKTCIDLVNQSFPMDASELAHQCLCEWHAFFKKYPPSTPSEK